MRERELVEEGQHRGKLGAGLEASEAFARRGHWTVARIKVVAGEGDHRAGGLRFECVEGAPVGTPEDAVDRARGELALLAPVRIEDREVHAFAVAFAQGEHGEAVVVGSADKGDGARQLHQFLALVVGAMPAHDHRTVSTAWAGVEERIAGLAPGRRAEAGPAAQNLARTAALGEVEEDHLVVAVHQDCASIGRPGEIDRRAID